MFYLIPHTLWIRLSRICPPLQGSSPTPSRLYHSFGGVMPRLLSLRSLFGVALMGLIAGATVLCAGRPNPGRAAGTTAPDREAVQRAHDTVKMLDDLHKGYVVTITATYVKAQERTPAAHVAKKVFAHMEKSGWGTARLIDATGSPTNKANVAKTEFEKRAIE